MKNSLIFLLLLSSQVYGRGEVGNGGDAVVCFEDKDLKERVQRVLLENQTDLVPDLIFDEIEVRRGIKSVTFFDVYEYTEEFGFDDETKGVYQSSEDFRVQVESLLKRLAEKSSFADYLYDAFQNIPYDPKWRPKTGVPAIDDEGMSYYLKPHCLLVQIAVQKSNFIFFDKHLFGQMDQLSKAALILHELVYIFREVRSAFIQSG